MIINEDNYLYQLQKHNEKALLYVSDKYGGLLKSIICKHMYHMNDKQEECFNDVLLKIWNNISSFDQSKNTFKNWIAAIAKYQSIDYLRKYGKELQNATLDDIVIAKEDTLLIDIIECEISEELEIMLSCLKPDDKILFHRLFVEEEEIEHISQETGISKNNIYKRISRGKEKIRKRFRENKSIEGKE